MPSSDRPTGRAGSRRMVLLVAATSLLLAACGIDDPSALQEAGMPDNPACRAPDAAAERLVAGSFEDANLVAGGEMFRVYGAEADPLREQVSGEAVEVDGLPVWKLDGTFAVTVDGERRSDAWMLWVGFAEDGFVVLCADGPADIDWPASSRQEDAAR